jgi:hypothetical protein
MRTKYIVIGVLVSVMAMSGAFASKALFPDAVYVQAQVTQWDPWTCVACNVNCETDGPLVCLVRVATTAGPEKVVYGRRLTWGWPETACEATPHFTNTPQTCPWVTVYDAR